LIARAAVVAHRGGRYDDLPGEQTLAHVARAISLGADFVEVDLRETADGRIVCVHDAEHAGLAVGASAMSALEEASRRAGVPAPPTLEALLDAVRGRIGLDLEIKEPGFEARAVAVVRAADPGVRVVWKSFHDDVVRALRRADPDCYAGLLLGTGQPRLGPLTRVGELFPEVRLRACGARFVSPHYRLVRAGFLRRMAVLGYPVLPWTVNDAAVMARLLPRVAGIVTDEPALCLTLRDGVR
jgi:glycerophosphoryl diester phosphodiesterase